MLLWDDVMARHYESFLFEKQTDFINTLPHELDFNVAFIQLHFIHI